MAGQNALLIDETEFDDESALVDVYKELIRIIEKDIDDLSPAKQGFTPWTLLAAMGAIIAVIFNIGKGVLDIQTSTVAGAFLLVHFLLQWLYMLVSVTSNGEPVKPHRVYYARKRLGIGLPVFCLRFLVLGFGFVLSLRVWDFDVFSIIGYLGFILVGAFYCIMLVVLAKNFLIGNNPAIYKKASLFWSVFLTAGYLLLIVTSYIKLPAPTEENFVSFAVGVLFAILGLLLDLYLSVIAPNPISGQLSHLRDDIVFRRLKVNDGLLAYRRIREGTLFLEEIQPELLAVDTKLDERFRNLETMRVIAQRMDQLLPRADASSQTIVSALDACIPYLETFHLARSNVERINKEIAPTWEVLVQKAGKVQSASGDSDSMGVMNSYVDSKDQLFRDEFNKLIEEANTIDRQKEELETVLASRAKLSEAPADAEPTRGAIN